MHLRMLLTWCCLALSPALGAGVVGDREVRLAASAETLPNGMVVILSPDHTVPGVSVLLSYGVGGGSEAPGEVSFAHLFEHLMFDGSAAVPGNEFHARLERFGARVNAMTGADRTVYFSTVPSALLESVLWMEAERLATLATTLDDAKVHREAATVAAEYHQRVRNQPFAEGERELLSAVVGPPYAPDPSGVLASLAGASSAAVKQFFVHHYAPDVLTLVITGDFDPALARRWVEEDFGPLARSPGTGALPPVVPPLQPRRIARTEPVNASQVLLGWRAASESDDSRFETKVLARVLAGTDAARLRRALTLDSGVASQVSATATPMGRTGMFEIEALVAPNEAPAEVISAIERELARMAKDGPTAQELDAAKRQVEVDVGRGLEPLVSRASLLEQLYREWKDPGAVPALLRRYRSVTAEGVRAVAAALVAAPRVEVVTTPAQKGGGAR